MLTVALELGWFRDLGFCALWTARAFGQEAHEFRGLGRVVASNCQAVGVWRVGG